MSTFLTKQEQNVAEKYLQFCKSFGISPVENYEEIITKNTIKTSAEDANASERDEVVEIYKNQCEALGTQIAYNLDEKPTCEIWNLILRDADLAINKEFNKEFAKIKDIILRKKIKIALQALYDEKIYVKKEQTKWLFACENDNEEIQEEYEKLGGSGKLLALSETSSYLYEEEEEVEDDEEDF